VDNVRGAVLAHFWKHKSRRVERPFVEEFCFSRLYQTGKSSLVKPFIEEEVKVAVWDCDSFKSPGPNDINFSFIKDFWYEVKVILCACCICLQIVFL